MRYGEIIKPHGRHRRRWKDNTKMSQTRSLSNDRSKTSSKASSPVLPSICSFNFQYLLVFLRPSSSCLRLLPRIPSLLSLLQERVSEVRSYVRCDQIQLPFLRFTVCRIFPSPLTLCNTSLFSTGSVHLILTTLVHP
jgi:hypothetical protein